MTEIFRFRAFDIINGTNVIPEKMATRDFIKSARGEVIEGSGRDVTPELVDGNGQAILGTPSEEASLLGELFSLGGAGSISGNKDRKVLQRLEDMGLLQHETVSLDCVNYKISDLGRAAVQELLKN